MRRPPASPPLFPQPGVMAALFRGHDWRATPFGPPSEWPEALRATLNLVLDARVPMMFGWGPELRVFYNDGYIPILGDKHPVLGQPAAEVFGELWAFVGPILLGVYESGEAVWLEDQLLPLARRGFLEDCWFTLSYSPIRDATGQVVGLLSCAVETSYEVLNRRRQQVLRRLADLRPGDRPERALEQASAVLADATDDLPFHVLLEAVGDRYRIAGCAGAALPWSDEVSADALEQAGWPVDGSSEPIDLPRLGGLALEAGARCERAVGVPLIGSDTGERVGVLIAGLGAGLAWDEPYQQFVETAGRSVAATWSASRWQQVRLAEAEDRYQNLFTQSLDGILLAEPDGTIREANPAACRILGFTEQEIRDGGRALLLDSDDPAVQEAVRVRRETGDFQGELRFRHRSGELVPCEVSSRIFRDVTDRERTIVVLRDVRARKALEQQLRDAQKLEALGRLAGGMAHDFNNLLTVIEAQVTFLRDQVAASVEATEDLDVIRETGRRGAALIRRLLAFVRQPGETPEVIRPVTHVSELAPLLRRLVGGGTELVFHFDERVPNVRMSPHHLEQILLNLVVNARDAVAESGRSGVIEVGVRADEGSDFVRFEVRDTGVGISDDQMPRLFDVFYTTKQEGTGIGLPTVRTVTEQAGGRIEVKSAVGEGSTLTVCIPAVHEDSGVVDAPPELSLTASRPARVLVVEDQPRVRQAMRRMLSAAGFEVVVAGNGDEALALAEARVPDLVVTDVVMPLVSGPELVRRLRARHPGVGALVVSGYTGDEVIDVEALGSPTRFLHKPFGAEALIRRVNELLEATGTAG